MSYLERGALEQDKTYNRRQLYHGFSPGEDLTFRLQTLPSLGQTSEQTYQIKIHDIREGGFFGKVIIPEGTNFVIKTSVPDAWHHFWRSINWDTEPFPAQYSEIAAQMEHLATKLIHRVLPVVSNGKFHSPDSYGYTHLSNGYAQVVERMTGRGPRFDTANNEYRQFRQAQQELFNIAIDLGLEQAGQIHPDNPFGMANLWYDPNNNKWIWLDTIPAIPQKGWIKPAFRFRQDIKDRLGCDNYTPFNRIHTDKFLLAIDKHRHLFSDQQYNQLLDDLFLYEELWQKNHHRVKKQDIQEPLKALQALAGDNPIIDFAKHPWKFFNGLFDKEAVLKGIKKAKAQGIVSDEEYNRAVQLFLQEAETRNNTRFNRKDVLTAMQLYYFAVGRFVDLTAALVAVNSLYVGDLAKTVEFPVIIEAFLPAILRGIGTVAASKISKMDLSTALKISLIPIIPFVGGYGSVAAQIAKDNLGSDNQLLHYQLRLLIAKLSSLSPSGGYGTELEARLWQAFGARLEKYIIGLSQKKRL